jgi:hypothetical protein
MFDDNKKIGMGLLALSLLFLSLGVIFFLDATLLAIGKPGKQPSLALYD